MPGKKFVFPLANVLKLRQHETERARQALVRLTMERVEQEHRVTEARERIHKLAEKAPAVGLVGPFALRQFDAFRRDAQRAQQDAARRLDRLRAEEERAREALMQRRRDEEALQTLHDQQRTEFIKEVETSENAFLDEQAISGHYRKTHDSQT